MMNNYNKCAIVNYKNIGLNNKDVRCHAFPKYDNIREE